MTSKRRDRRTRRCFARSAGQFCQSLLRQFLPQAKLPHTFAEGGHNDSHKCGHSAYKTQAVEGWFPGAGVHRKQRVIEDFVRAGHQFGIFVVAEIVDKGRSVSVTTDGACIGNPGPGRVGLCSSVQGSCPRIEPPRKDYALSGRYLRRQFGSTATAAVCKSVLLTGERVLRFEQGFNATEQ